MRFKLDENMPADLAVRLREAGHDAESVADEGLSGAADSPVLAAATAERRILMTFDLDFADVRHYPPGTYAGIVVFRLEDQRWQSLQGPLERPLSSGRVKTLDQGLAVVDETRVRFRRPKQSR